MCIRDRAFIVLYNLNNINITERVREIATIKVLGFYPKETASYVFRENMVLTAIGCGLGLILGKWFHRFVMGEIQIDMVLSLIHILYGKCTPDLSYGNYDIRNPDGVSDGIYITGKSSIFHYCSGHA